MEDDPLALFDDLTPEEYQAILDDLTTGRQEYRRWRRKQRQQKGQSMASEHQHTWEPYSDEWGVMRISCPCGEDLLWSEFWQAQQQRYIQALALLREGAALEWLTTLPQWQDNARAFLALKKETSDGR